MPGLILKNVTKAFDDIQILEDISLELKQGELLVLLGPSGCGKSTLLRLIAGLEKLDRGEIYIGSRRVDHLRPKDRDVALVFQNYSLYPHMSVARNLAFPLVASRVKGSQIQEQVRRVAEMLELTDRLKSKPAQLSGGQRQRVALGRAMIRQPSLFLLDEPLSNLDADLRARMRQEIVRIQKELGVTTIHVTHDQAEALTMGDRIALLHEGKIAQIGTPQKLYYDPANLFVAQFIGHPKMNILEAKIEQGMLAPFSFPLPNQLPCRTGDCVLVGIRPEQIEIGPEGEYTAKVVSCEYLGGSYVVTLAFQDTLLTVSNCPAALETDASVRFSICHHPLYFFDPANGRKLRAP
jgi:multiple sugar transport system ATP-binding protein